MDTSKEIRVLQQQVQALTRTVTSLTEQVRVLSSRPPTAPPTSTSTEATPAFKGPIKITLVRHSKHIEVKGNSFNVRGTIKENKGKWDKDARVWKIPVPSTHTSKDYVSVLKEIFEKQGATVAMEKKAVTSNKSVKGKSEKKPVEWACDSMEQPTVDDSGKGCVLLNDSDDE